MSLDPEPDQPTHTVLVWLGIAQRLHDRGDDPLAGEIWAAMDRRRLDELVPFDLTDDERVRVQATLGEESGGQ
ncbi:MAG: hypothetical protein M3R02_09665 [Chloroflexota bacterium]|nr:hypothetical protein [Chloroflexota bacterium]